MVSEVVQTVSNKAKTNIMGKKPRWHNQKMTSESQRGKLKPHKSFTSKKCLIENTSPVLICFPHLPCHKQRAIPQFFQEAIGGKVSVI